MPRKSTLTDKKDLKILAELDKNARQAESKIARKIGLSKQVVHYRIQKLIETGIITNFYTVVNVGKLGLNTYYVFLQLEKVNREQEKELLNKLKSLGCIGWLVSGTGRWDVVLLVYADSITTFDRFLSQITAVCGGHIHEINFTTLITSEHISYKFLRKERAFETVKQTERMQAAELSKTDKQVLECISQDSRAPLAEVSRKIKIPIHIVDYHLKNMVKKKIIIAFKPKINISKFSYQWHLLLIQFQTADEKSKKEFINFCKQHDKIYYVTNTIGLYNVMLDVLVKNTEEFKEVLLELKERFSNTIKLYESLIIFDEYKIDYFPRSLIS